MKGALKQELLGLDRSSKPFNKLLQVLVEGFLQASIFFSFIKERFYLLWVSKLLIMDNNNTNEYKKEFYAMTKCGLFQGFKASSVFENQCEHVNRIKKKNHMIILMMQVMW